MRLIILLTIICVVHAIGFSATLKVPSQYPTIQDAIDAAVNGDTVLVKPGTYVENIDFKGKAITVTSEQGAAVTVIDGNQAGSVVTCQSVEGLDSVLEGFTVTNGKANFGGGICCDHSSPTITKNTITENSASHGGGIGCPISSSPNINNNTITGNSADIGGGGILCLNLSSATIMNNTITGNTTGFDGGGGGIHCVMSNPTITNTILWDNFAPTGPEIWIGIPGHHSILTISYSDVEGGQSSCFVDPSCTLNWGPGMIDSDPLFVDPVNNEFHLTFNSPCRGSGDNLVVTEPCDFEGDPRIAYGTVDIGADEFYTHLYWTGNAIPGGNVEIKFVGLPGTSPVGLCIGSGVLDPPIPSMWGDWYLAFPIIGPVDLGSITSPEGVLVVPGVIPGTSPPPYSIPMQALVGAELTNLCVMNVE